ncbi:mechanosensitive ion channel domain-containing protein [Flavobacterium sp. '19STA2R22 D10 B1']|uniref:mechanosensitive ion channel domain-containing protein n=1 Tax=Flavobacterium aerium TaxID=3037261 RepID=UPI00278BBD7D|nr:mechanosensitive ion channel domain-containing protein [Flavobacterium sp. '19STA2R22 D10 B1']
MIKEYLKEIISSGIVIILMIISRFVVSFLIRSFAKVSQSLEHRTKLVIKYINIFITLLGCLALFFIWGVQPNNLFVALSSVFAVIGVAMFAQWSILSNITAGVILFFSFPFKIGDIIHIHDKDFAIEDAEITDIKAFHIYLKTKDGELITYPNNLLLQKGITIVNHKTETKKEPQDHNSQYTSH